MTERVKQYRLNADKCLELAQRLSDPESKHSLLVIANAWLMLAEQRAKNIETPPLVSEAQDAHSARKRA
jgi:hypothetical protein